MQKSRKYWILRRKKAYKFLLLLFVAVFAAYPVLDAYSDAFNSSLPAVNEIDDDPGDDHVSFHTVKHASHDYYSSGHVVFLAATAISGLSYLITNAPAHVQGIKSLQSCRPLSSDLSPPVL